MDNLTKQEKRGIAKLRRRSKAGELVVSKTDKSGRLTISTMDNSCNEDCLSKLEEPNAKICQGQIKSDNMMVGSLDVTVKYPSIDTKHAGRIIRDSVKDSKLSMEGVSDEKNLIYLKLVMKPVDIVDAGIQGILPMKLAKARIDPTIKFVGADDVRDIWWYPVTPEELTAEQRKLIMGYVICHRGTTMENLLCNKKPWTSKGCPREQCKICPDQPGACRKMNLTYEIRCKICKDKGITSVYLGETHRACWDRHQDHMDSLRRHNP